MKLLFTDEFKRDIQKIKNQSCQEKIKKIITENPGIGKSLKYDLADLRSVRITKARF